jgi:hypothetical protein
VSRASGVCGGGFSKISEAHFGCSTARNKGETVCGNRLTIRRDALEATVMNGLRSRLVDPDLFKVFAQEFTTEWNRLQAGAESSVDRVRSEHQRVCRQIERLVDALVDGEPAARLKDKVRELERRRLELERGPETAKAPAPRLHPNLAEVYRRKVEELHHALKQEDAGASARARSWTRRVDRFATRGRAPQGRGARGTRCNSSVFEARKRKSSGWGAGALG